MKERLHKTYFIEDTWYSDTCLYPKESQSKSNRKCWMWKKKERWRRGWMRSLLICLTHSLLKWEWMEGFPMSWLEDGWVCSYGFNWLKTGIQLGIIESWKSLKAQVHEIIRRANQVVINSRCKLSVGYGRKGTCYPAIFKVAWRWCKTPNRSFHIKAHLSTLKLLFLLGWLGSYLLINECSVLIFPFTFG